ncbi:RES family NAD+ phosphorylase [Pelagibius sp. Alg239-R121]|uniref:RES family NAD+ phosphorylase n=1 Tax=Pelagibius sp. Alg239-R121 TaxID=2993448 RepID=UPI0024A6DB4F|nr:RES family NAD+ phosphorylase [Pelagibius sp. Alg239-R121]
MIVANEIPLSDFTQATTIRLISTAYIDESAMLPLVDNNDDLAFLEEIEGMTSTRRGDIVPLPGGIHPDELLTEVHGFGWAYVNAAFCYTREGGNRFNGSERGAWYAAWGDNAVTTAHADVSWHLTRELDATGVYENTTAYRELLAGFTVRFHNVNGCDAGLVLDPDAETGYPAGQALALELLNAGSHGLLYPSVRRADGQCLVAFRPHVVQNIRQGNTWVLAWHGTREPEITQKF